MRVYNVFVESGYTGKVVATTIKRETSAEAIAFGLESAVNVNGALVGIKDRTATTNWLRV